MLANLSLRLRYVETHISKPYENEEEFVAEFTKANVSSCYYYNLYHLVVSPTLMNPHCSDMYIVNPKQISKRGVNDNIPQGTTEGQEDEDEVVVVVVVLIYYLFLTLNWCCIFIT